MLQWKFLLKQLTFRIPIWVTLARDQPPSSREHAPWPRRGSTRGAARILRKALYSLAEPKQTCHAFWVLVGLSTEVRVRPLHLRILPLWL